LLSVEHPDVAGTVLPALTARLAATGQQDPHPRHIPETRRVLPVSGA